MTTSSSDALAPLVGGAEGSPQIHPGSFADGHESQGALADPGTHLESCEHFETIDLALLEPQIGV